VFYLDVAYVCNDFQVFSGGFFYQVFQKHVSSVSSVFFSMLQVLHLDVSKVNRASVVDLHPVGVDQIFSGVSRLHGGYWRRTDHAPATVVKNSLRQLSSRCLWRVGPAWAA
jgi:hypothetical protein